MSKEDRLKIIRELQTKRNSLLVSYVTSTRPQLEVPMAMDCVRKIYDHLKAPHEPAKRNIDLFLHSNGGDGTVPWRLVTLIREFAGKFSVLVPYRAFSAATLTALGADSIVMHSMGVLGPTDPTVQNPFNPKDPANPTQALGISVEDVTAYIALIKEDAGIQHEDEMVIAFNQLASQVHPLALGNVKRSISQSRMMARKLLSLHMDAKDSQRIADIVDNLTSKLFYHGHPINRLEAKDLGIPTVESPDTEVEDLIWKLYLEYEAEIKMESRFDLIEEFTTQFPTSTTLKNTWHTTTSVSAKMAYIESESSSDALELQYQVTGTISDNGAINCNLLVVKQGWIKE